MDSPHCGATLYWTQRYGAQATWAGIGEEYERLHGTGGALGFPVTPEEEALPAPTGTTGWVQRFEGGWIHWCEPFGSHASSGPIGECFAGSGGTGGFLGFPASAETEAAPSWRGTVGRIQSFESGAVYWSEGTGAQPVTGWIGVCFDGMGGTASRLGFPTTPEFDAAESPMGTKGRFQRFEGPWDYADDLARIGDARVGATVYWSERYGAHATWCGIGATYEGMGGTSSELGFPTSGELEQPWSPHGTSGAYQCFEGGAIFYRTRGDALHAVLGHFWHAYRGAGHSRGALGFPTGDVGEMPTALSHLDGHEARAQEFEGGWLYTTDGSSAHTWLKDK